MVGENDGWKIKERRSKGIWRWIVFMKPENRNRIWNLRAKAREEEMFINDEHLSWQERRTRYYLLEKADEIILNHCRQFNESLEIIKENRRLGNNGLWWKWISEKKDIELEESKHEENAGLVLQK